MYVEKLNAKHTKNVSGITFHVKLHQASFFIFNGDQYFMSGGHFKTSSRQKVTLKKMEKVWVLSPLYCQCLYMAIIVMQS